MKKTLWPRAGPFAFAVLCFFPSLALSRDSTRVINTCLLNDEDFPADREKIEYVFNETSSEFEARVQIKFRAVDYGVFKARLHLYLNADSTTVGNYLSEAQKICSDSTEVIIIFSSSEAISTDGKRRGIWGEVPFNQGLVVVYEFNYVFSRRDRSGTNASVTNLKHELGHLFIPDLHFGEKSFMFTRSADSFGRWTSGVIKAILENKYARWPLSKPPN